MSLLTLWRSIVWQSQDSEFSEFYWILVEKKLRPPKKTPPQNKCLWIWIFIVTGKQKDTEKCYIDLIYIYICYT